MRRSATYSGLAALSGLLCALAWWLSGLDFTHWVKTRDRASHTWPADASWTGGGEVL